MVGWGRAFGALAAVVVSACGQELQLGSSTGLDPIAGETLAVLDDSVCGQSYGDCRVHFERDVVIATKKSYVKLDGLVSYVKAVDLDVRVLTFVDGDTAVKFVPEGTVTIAGELQLHREELMMLPQQLRIEGDTFEPVRKQILNGEPATLRVVADVVVPQPLPSYLVVRYDVQPSLIIGEQ